MRNETNKTNISAALLSAAHSDPFARAAIDEIANLGEGPEYCENCSKDIAPFEKIASDRPRFPEGWEGWTLCQGCIPGIEEAYAADRRQQAYEDGPVRDCVDEDGRDWS